MDMNPKTERISTLLKFLKAKIIKRNICDVFDVEIAPCGYREDDGLPTEELEWKQLNGTWAGEKRDSHYWMRFTVNVPQEQGIYRVCLETSDNQWKWDDCDNPQILVYVDGEPVKALSWGHRYFTVESGIHEVYMYAYTGCWVNEIWADETRSFLLRMSLVEINYEVEQLYYDIVVPFETALTMDEGNYYREKILNTLNEALTVVDIRQGSKAFSTSVEEARTFMAQRFYGEICQEGDVKAILTGHAHIDIAWLWPARQSREKAERTFTGILGLMKQYPETCFFASSPVLYKWIKSHSPQLYKRIKEMQQEGRWEADGGAWVEPDMNMPSGESFVRQFLYGKRFFQEEFGVESKILWVPDCFGFAGTLPQIMKGCGIEQLVTNKLTWNDMNKMPYDIFKWRGTDGSEVHAYFMTAQDVPLSDGKGNRKAYTTYSSTATPSQVIGAWEGFREKEITPNVHLAYGFGDGGGGPTEEQIEYIRRMSFGIPGVPTTRQGSVQEFISVAQKDIELHSDICPKWDGELYFEFHRGIFTSISKNKYNNRRAEFGIQRSEWLSTAASVLGNANYPKEILDDCWEKVLEYQFHDILPGSSIREVYEETDIGYGEVFESIGKITTEAQNVLKTQFPISGTVIWNDTPMEQSAPVYIDNTCVEVENIPPHGYKIVQSYSCENTILANQNGLENQYIKVTLDDKKRIYSIFDKRAHREIIPEGKIANRLVVYDDFPTYFDAWELRRQYRMKSYEIDDVSECCVVQDGCRTGIRVKRNYLNSTINQTMWIYENSAQIDFELDVDWQSQKTLLKTEFPVDINTTRAICDAPYGIVERSITQNTTWEQAKFEVCAHKFVDLSEGDYGVSLITDSKYGYSFKERQMEVSLLRTPAHPYPEADIGMHKICYALYPHEKDFYHSNVMEKAYVFNNPLRTEFVEKGQGTLPEKYSFITSDSDHVAIDTIKKAENGMAIIVRMYEFGNAWTKTKIDFGFPIKAAVRCNMLEQEEGKLSIENNSVSCEIKPFEIVTLKIMV